jgi:Na+-driven multidrug efflux pump
MEWSLFLPLLLGGLAYGVVAIVAGVLVSRGNDAGAARVRDYGFVLVLAMGAWTVILLIISIFNEPDDVGDLLTITLVIAVFFAILLLVFFGLAALFGALGRVMSRRERITADDV